MLSLNVLHLDLNGHFLSFYCRNSLWSLLPGCSLLIFHTFEVAAHTGKCPFTLRGRKQNLESRYTLTPTPRSIDRADAIHNTTHTPHTHTINVWSRDAAATYWFHFFDSILTTKHFSDLLGFAARHWSSAFALLGAAHACTDHTVDFLKDYSDTQN